MGLLRRWISGLRFATAVVAALLSIGAVLTLLMIIKKQPDPPSLEDADQAAHEYVRILADGDFDSYHGWVNHVLGVTVEDAFRAESGCLDWRAVTVTVEEHPIASYMAVATFSDGSASVVRDFQWTVTREPLFLTGSWIPTVDESC